MNYKKNVDEPAYGYNGYKNQVKTKKHKRL